MKLSKGCVKNSFLLFLSLFVVQGFFSTYAQEIGAVSIDFCVNPQNPVRHARFAVQSGKPYELCLQAKNADRKSHRIQFGFVDGTLSNGGNKACLPGGEFSHFVQFDQNMLSLAPGDEYSFTGILQFPLGYSGQLHACLVYSLLDDQAVQKNQGNMFTILVRKVQFFDGVVVGSFERGVEVGRDIQYSFSGGVLSGAVWLTNTGDVDERVLVTGTIANILGYARSLDIVPAIVPARSGLWLPFSRGDIPGYQGVYDIDLAFSFSPGEIYDISAIPELLKKSLVFERSYIVWSLPRKIVGEIVGVLCILFFVRYLLYRRKKTVPL